MSTKKQVINFSTTSLTSDLEAMLLSLFFTCGSNSFQWVDQTVNRDLFFGELWKATEQYFRVVTVFVLKYNVANSGSWMKAMQRYFKNNEFWTSLSFFFLRNFVFFFWLRKNSLTVDWLDLTRQTGYYKHSAKVTLHLRQFGKDK